MTSKRGENKEVRYEFKRQSFGFCRKNVSCALVSSIEKYMYRVFDIVIVPTLTQILIG